MEETTVNTMQPVRILWLYDDLLDLYGDGGNLSMLRRRIEEMGYPSRLDRRSLGEPLEDLEDYHLVYLGPGKAANLAKAAGHFTAYAQQVKAAVEAGVVFLVTGNARLLFGRSFTAPGGQTLEGVGLFDYTGNETGNVFVSDVAAAANIPGLPHCYGFINRTAHIEGNAGGRGGVLFEVLSGSGDGDPQKEKILPGQRRGEGNLYQNFFGTWLLGPVLVKNPALCREVLRRVLSRAGLELGSYDDSMEQKALDLTLAEIPVQEPAGR